MELKWLEDFLAVAEVGSFTRAAELRNVTQPAFGRRIRALERWLGATLIDRDSFPLALTPAGRLFREMAADLVQQLYGLRHEFAERAIAEEDVISFASPHVLAVSFFPVWLRRLKAVTGPFQTRVVCDNVLECIQRLTAGDCQFYVGFHHPQIPLVLAPSAYAHLPLGTEKLSPYSAKREDGSPLFDLPGRLDAPLPYLSYGAGTFLDRAIELQLKAAPVTACLSRVFDNSVANALKAMVADGQGIAWLPESLVTAEDLDGRLTAIGDDIWSVPLGLRLYRRIESASGMVDRIWRAQSSLSGSA